MAFYYSYAMVEAGMFAAISENEFSTPMMLQYLELKKQYSDCLLFFRLGDFYELFLDDALIGAKVLDITLTGRSRGKDGRIPMAGVPYHAVDNYLGKLIKAGYKVAICEQMTPPDKKGLVERDVVRIVTPGTLTDQKMLRDKENNFLLCLDVDKGVLGAAVVDLSTGQLQLNHFPVPTVSSLVEVINQLITQLQPRECILTPTALPDSDVARTLATFSDLYLFPFTGWVTSAKSQQHIIHQTLPKQSLQPLDTTSQPAVRSALANLLSYITHTQKTQPQHLQPPTLLLGNQYVQLDRSTIVNLELLSTLRHQQTAGSLLDVLDQTQTAVGGRLLKHWLLQPLVNAEQITQRLDAVDFLVHHQTLREALRHELDLIHDIERLVARLSLGNGSPRDLKSLEHSLKQTLMVSDLLQTTQVPTILRAELEALKAELDEIRVRIADTIVDEPPFDPKAGGLIRTGVNAQLDTLQETTAHNRQWLVEFETRERAATSISTLKVKYNQVFGFYIEISKANLHLAPDHYFRKQTLVNAERFTTPELQEREKILLTAESQMQQIEFQLFSDLVSEVLLHIPALHRTSQTIAQIDCLASLATVAIEQQYVRPTLNQTGKIELIGSRHPVVEQIISTQKFVPNDVTLDIDTNQLLLLTGPNMAGKSVLMRQVALITIMVHIGSFVPAQSASVSLTDQIFVRSGAADMITAGLSTFMVEMVETANILRHATDRSLVIMDEIGRGTSTHDGISIAWAVAEHLVANMQPGPKTLFATHYHELQSLADRFPTKVHNFHMAITEHDQKLVFLYQLTPGGTSQSFGLAVAELAGVPQPVIERARVLLKDMQHEPDVLTASPKTTSSTKTNDDPQVEALLAKLTEVDINSMTPIEALNLVAELKSRHK